MGARQKINSGAVNAILIFAGIIAAIGGSWPLFFGLVVVLLGMALHDGTVRLSPRSSRRR